MTTEESAPVAEGTAVPAESQPAVTEVTTQPEGVTETEVSTTEVQSSGDDSPVNDEQPDSKPEIPRRNQRIIELNRRAKEAESERLAFQQRAEAAEARIKEIEVGKRPTLEDFDYDQTAYEAAVEEHVSKQNRLAARQEMLEQHNIQAEEANKAAESAVRDAFFERTAAFEAEHPDFRQKVTDPRFQQSAAVNEALMVAENGPAIAYHLASNLDLSNQLQAMHPAMAMMELGRISAQISAPPPVVTSSTPAPAAPVKPTGTVERSMDNWTKSEWAEWAAKRGR